MSTINYTYNVIVDRFRQFAAGHFQLRRFTHGEISQADLEKEAEWPWLHVKPRAINYAPGTRAFSFEIFISDLPRDKEDKTGYQAESITDCSLIFQDLINEIYLGNMFGDQVVLSRPVNSEPFVEQYTHTLTGVTGIIELNLDYDWSACSIPASWNYNTPTDSPSDGWGALQFIESLDQNGVFVSLLNDEEAPGNSYYYGTDAEGVKGWHAIVDNIGLTCETLPDCATIIGITEDIIYLLDTIALKANTADISAVGFSNDYNDLDNLPTIPAAQVNSDWNATSGVAEILNKPTIPTSLPPSGAAGGDLQGNYPNPTVHRVHGVDFQSGAPAVDDTWVYVSTPFGTQPFQWQHNKLKTSQVQNDSTVTGTNADDALEHLDSTKVPTTRTISTTAPLAGGGDLSANRTLSITQANTSTNGFLSSTDWNTFNGKQNALGFTPVPETRTLTINGTTQDLSANRTFTIATGLTVGTTPITSGTVGRVLFEGTGNVLQESANLFWDNTNARLGIGTATPANTLDVNGTARITDNLFLANAKGLYFTTTALGILGNSGIGTISFLTNSISRLSIDNSGNINALNSPTAAFSNIFITGSNIEFRNGIHFFSWENNGTLFQIKNITNANTIPFAIFKATNNIGIGTTTDAGYKLDVNGTARVTSTLTVGSDLQATTFGYGNGQGNTKSFQTQGVNTGVKITFQDNNPFTGTSGNVTQTYIINQGFNPTSGTATYTGLLIGSIINQTGGANGITRGLYINPTLTAAADFRAIEVASGITILGAATTAKASLRIPSGTAPTSPVNGDIWFDGTDIKMRIGGVTKTFTLT